MLFMSRRMFIHVGFIGCWLLCVMCVLFVALFSSVCCSLFARAMLLPCGCVRRCFLFAPAVCAIVGVVSISITFFNKAVLSSYAFRYPNLMTLFQMAFSLILLMVAKSASCQSTN